MMQSRIVYLVHCERTTRGFYGLGGPFSDDETFVNKAFAQRKLSLMHDKIKNDPTWYAVDKNELDLEKGTLIQEYIDCMDNTSFTINASIKPIKLNYEEGELNMTEHVYAILQKKESLDGKYTPKYALVYSTIYTKAMLRNLEWNKIRIKAEDANDDSVNYSTDVVVDDDNESIIVVYKNRFQEDHKPTHKVSYYKVEMDVPCPSNVSLKNETGHIVLNINSENDLFVPKVVATYGTATAVKHYSSHKNEYYCFNFTLNKGAVLDFHYRGRENIRFV